jgi:hypothetical protein
MYKKVWFGHTYAKFLTVKDWALEFIEDYEIFTYIFLIPFISSYNL